MFNKRIIEIAPGLITAILGAYVYFNGGTPLYLILGIVFTIVLFFIDDIKSYLESQKKD